MKSEFVFEWLGKVVFGEGCLEKSGEECIKLGNKAIFVTTPDLAILPMASKAVKYLESAGVEVALYTKVTPDPTSQDVDFAAEVMHRFGANVIVGFGGGSSLDFAKGLAVAATHPGSVWDYVNYTGANAKSVTSAALPVLAIPTTAGTGSEATQGAVLHNTGNHMKAALLSAHVFPKTMIVDPALTYDLPPKITAMTGFDALTHGMESYLNASKSSPFSDLLACDTTRIVAENLPKVMANPHDYDARAKMSWAATLSGISIALAGTTVAHAMGLPLGARMHVPHGLGLALLLPIVLKYSKTEQITRCAHLAETVGAANGNMTDEEKCDALLVWLDDFIKKIGLDKLCNEVKAEDEMIDILTDDVFRYMGRPVSQHRPVFTRDEIRMQYAEALKK